MEKSKVAYISPEFINNGEPNDSASAETSSLVSGDAYERMCASLYAYRFGTIGFLDLLATFEEILGIKPPQTNE